MLKASPHAMHTDYHLETPNENPSYVPTGSAIYVDDVCSAVACTGIDNRPYGYVGSIIYGTG